MALYIDRSRASVLENTPHSTNETGATNCYIQETEEKEARRHLPASGQLYNPNLAVYTYYMALYIDRSRASVLETLRTAQTRLVLQTATSEDRRERVKPSQLYHPNLAVNTYCMALHIDSF